MYVRVGIFFFFFFNDTATTEIYTLSLHDALPICDPRRGGPCRGCRWCPGPCRDRKSTRLNSSHGSISYAVFCLKKKKNQLTTDSACRAPLDRRHRAATSPHY